MRGQALSLFLWPNHIYMHDFFMSKVNEINFGSYLEVGVGPGVSFLEKVKLQKKVRDEKTPLFDRLIGVDLSQSSIDLTKSLIDFHGLWDINQNRISLICAAFSTDEFCGGDEFSLVVVEEVLEHVENPEDFLRNLRKIVTQDTKIYITTCINCPAIDHIYHFKTITEVEDMISKAGFVINDSLSVPYFGKTIGECKEGVLPINVAYFLTV